MLSSDLLALFPIKLSLDMFTGSKFIYTLRPAPKDFKWSIHIFN